MELITRENYKLVRKEERNYKDKETGEEKVLKILYLTNTENEIQEQIILNDKELFEKIKEKQIVKLQFEKDGKYTKLKDIIAVKL